MVDFNHLADARLTQSVLQRPPLAQGVCILLNLLTLDLPDSLFEKVCGLQTKDVCRSIGLVTISIS